MVIYYITMLTRIRRLHYSKRHFLFCKRKTTKTSDVVRHTHTTQPKLKAEEVESLQVHFRNDDDKAAGQLHVIVSLILFFGVRRDVPLASREAIRAAYRRNVG